MRAHMQTYDVRLHVCWKMTFFESAILNFFSKKINLLHLKVNKLGVHMRYHLFLHYGWFLQNLGKDFIQTNMHTTVYVI